MHQQFTMMHSRTGGNNNGEWGKCIYTTGYENEGKIFIVYSRQTNKLQLGKILLN